MSHLTPATLPAQLAGYAVHRELPADATYLAQRAGRTVILKRLEEDCLLGGELHPLIHDRLARVRELAHVGVANLIGVEAEADQAYLVWEHVEGAPFVEHARSLDDRRRAMLARDLIAAVETLHALGIVHGEIHGGNVFIAPTGRVMLTHISPLLYNDVQVDIDAVVKLLRDIGFTDLGGVFGAGGASSLRQIASAIGAPRQAHPSPSRADPSANETGGHRRRSLLAAALLAAVGAAIAFGLWSWTSTFSDADQLAPTPRSSRAVERGAS